LRETSFRYLSRDYRVISLRQLIMISSAYTRNLRRFQDRELSLTQRLRAGMVISPSTMCLIFLFQRAARPVHADMTSRFEKNVSTKCEVKCKTKKIFIRGTCFAIPAILELYYLGRGSVFSVGIRTNSFGEDQSARVHSCAFLVLKYW
jgi:hypothetical protein